MVANLDCLIYFDRLQIFLQYVHKKYIDNSETLFLQLILEIGDWEGYACSSGISVLVPGLRYASASEWFNIVVDFEKKF